VQPTLKELNRKTIMAEPASKNSPKPPGSLASTARASWRDEYPFESSYLQLGQHQLHYIDRAPDGQPEASEPSDERSSSRSGAANRDPVLMVHGNPTWSFYYRRLISRLSADRRVVAVDHLGCGLSDKPTDYDYCLQAHIENLCALIDHTDLKNVTLMAHDWGGAIGMGALLARKARFKKIILFNTAAFPPPYIPFRIRVCRWPVFGKLAVQGCNAFARAATTMATERKGGLPPAVAEGLLFPYDNWANRTAIYQFVKDIPLSPKHRTWSVLADIESQLSDLADWPSMLMWGMKDWCFRPECLRRFQQHWPGAITHEVTGAGHYVVEDAAEQVEKRVLEFL
jgi:pimeloyl-ACP methyl ester carboxylesterase